LTAKGLERLPGLLDKHQPDLLILIHGGNDMLRKKSLQKATDNLRQMIALSRNRGIPVVMMAVPNPTLVLSPADFYEELASEMSVPIEIDAIADILQYPSNKSDAVHPNAKGYRMMAESLQDLLSSTGAL
jgi:lysophospholipase L1-like esterase